MDGLKERAKLLTETCNKMDNVTCNKIEGSMYGFPQVHFSENAKARAAEKNVPVDFMYCMDMVNATGIMTVPGSGFGQKDGSYHYRITNLVTPTSDMVETLDLLSKFNTTFHERWQ